MDYVTEPAAIGAGCELLEKSIAVGGGGGSGPSEKNVRPLGRMRRNGTVWQGVEKEADAVRQCVASGGGGGPAKSASCGGSFGSLDCVAARPDSLELA